MKPQASLKRSIVYFSVSWLPAAALALLSNPAYGMTISASIPNANSIWLYLKLVPDVDT